MKDGYYWVKWCGNWIIAKNENAQLEMVGSGFYMNEEDFDEIGDYIETPEKYK